jgi:signal transduction histidine kinase
MVATFGVLGTVVVAGLVLPDEPEGFTEEAAQRLLVVGLALFPWLLFRFAAAMEPAPRRTEILVGLLAAAVVVATLALPTFPGADETRPGYFQAYLALFVGAWFVVSAVVARRLWTAGAGEPRLARRRMRLLAGASITMASCLVLAGAAGGGRDTVATAVTQALALGASGLFYAGYAPPTLLRLWWRRAEEAGLRAAELQLLGARDQGEITQILLPAAAELVGARAVALVDSEGAVAGTFGELPSDAGPVLARDRVVTVPMRSGSLIVATSPYAPVFGEDEFALLASLGVTAELAFDRARTLEAIQQASGDLERTNEALEQFAYIASHDLKEPLRSIAGFAEVLGRMHAEALGETGRNHLERIMAATERMHDLIDDLLAFSRVGGRALEPIAVDVGAAVQECLEGLATAVSEREASVTVRALPPAVADPALVAQVFQNLVANALKYGGEQPRVEIGGRPGEEWNEYWVSDHGPGVAPSDQERIFQPFQRAHSSESGTGIGLALVRRIVELHGGQVWVDSVPGQGATFGFTLPAAA